MGSILFNKLDLPTETPPLAPSNGTGQGPQAELATISGGSAKAKGKAKGNSNAKQGVSNGTGGVAAKGGEDSEGEGASFTRIEIRVGRITKVCL